MARWENNLARPRPAMLEKIAAALDVSLDSLVAAEHGENAAIWLQELDPDLLGLLRQIHKLGPRDQEGLKIILESMLTKAQMHELLGRGSTPEPQDKPAKRGQPPRARAS
jgi:transcriptional regulator with XRE-family HTH domain